MERIWVKEYQPGVPFEVNVDDGSLVTMFEKACQSYGARPAFENFGFTITYAELASLVGDFAAFLSGHCGLKQGERFALMLPNILQYPVALFAALRAGLIIVNINPLYTASELSHQLKDSEAKGIIVLENFAATLQEIVHETAVEHVVVTKLGDLFNFSKGLVLNFFNKYIKKMVPKWQIDNSVLLLQALSIGRDAKLQPVTISNSDIAFLQYTGGTTGKSKGAILTHRNMVANVLQATAWLDGLVTEGQEVIITALPLYHIFSLTANCLTFFKLGALNVLITNPRDIKSFIKVLKHVKFTAITGVNTLFNALLNNPGFAKLDFSHLHLTLGGGMAVQESVAERWKKITGKPLIEAYGLTETSPAVCMNPMNLKAYNGMIGLPIPSTQISIRDSDGRELSCGKPGDLWVKGPQVMRGYWQRPEETDMVLQDGWLLTGDVAVVDDRGYVKLVDRKKDLIIVSGFNVYPNEIEDLIAKMPGITEVAVVGVQDEVSGERVKAYVVADNSELNSNDVINYCKKYLTAYKVPKVVEFKTELPKSNVGKILRRALRENH